jgi:hypothetical protein
VLIDDGYMGSGVIVNRAFDKYGIENFSKEIITSCVDNFEANVLEKYYIAKEKPKYNITGGGDGGLTSGSWKKGNQPWNIGMKNEYHYKLSEETKKKQSENWRKGHPNASLYKNGKKNKGKHFYNNGKICISAFECPEGFKPGRLPMTWLDRDEKTGRFKAKDGIRK